MASVLQPFLPIPQSLFGFNLSYHLMSVVSQAIDQTTTVLSLTQQCSLQR